MSEKCVRCGAELAVSGEGMNRRFDLCGCDELLKTITGMSGLPPAALPPYPPRIVPDHILKLANENVIVDYAVKGWRAGKLNWEEAMMAAVYGLCRQIEARDKAIGELMAVRLAEPKIIGGKE